MNSITDLLDLEDACYTRPSHTLKNFDYPTFFCLTIFPT